MKFFHIFAFVILFLSGLLIQSIDAKKEGNDIIMLGGGGGGFGGGGGGGQPSKYF